MKQEKRPAFWTREAAARCVLASWCVLMLFFAGAPVHAVSGSQARPASAAYFAGDIQALHSPNAILLREKDGRVLMRRASRQTVYPASMTKMMTVLVALQALEDPDQEVTIDASIYADLWAANASMAGFVAGERVTVRDLVYGALLPSGAECAVTLADAAYGSQERFVEQMNGKAKSLGMEQTHFTNVTGLHDNGQVSTVEDMMRLLREALQNELFAEAATSKTFTTSPTAEHPQGVYLQSTLFRHREGWSFPGGEILGGKTGYTDAAGQCLASVARVGKERYLLVTAGAPGDPKTEQLHIADAFAVYSAVQADGVHAPSEPGSSLARSIR